MKRLVALSIFSFLLLSGCTSGDGTDNNILIQIFVDPFTFLIKSTATLFDESYGISIVLITLLIRLILMPFMLKQYKNQQHMKDKMVVIKPEMERIQGEIKKTNDQEKKNELQKDMMNLYTKHGVNPLSVGCLPMLIQAPILMGFYYAIQRSTEIATHNFLWFNLGEPNILLAVIAGVIYYIQAKIQHRTMSMEQQANPMMRWMGLISPIMILVISLTVPAALPLYWAVGGLFLIIQTWFSNEIYLKRLNHSKV